MRISSITISNFRCFGPEPTTINLSDLTALIGTNGCGKSAALHALIRLFGLTGAERNLERADFHVPMGKKLEEVGECELTIEVRLDFPELVGTTPEGEEEPISDTAIAECFRHMVVKDEGASLRTAACGYAGAGPRAAYPKVTLSSKSFG